MTASDLERLAIDIEQCVAKMDPRHYVTAVLAAAAVKLREWAKALS